MSVAPSNAAVVLLACLATSWPVALTSGALTSQHPCSSAPAVGTPGHARHQLGFGFGAQTEHPVLGSHECSHCAAPQCASGQHCALNAPLALGSAPPTIEVVTSTSPPVSWLRDRPLSSNPTPPIPPPQPVL